MEQICDCDGPDCVTCFMIEGDGFEEEIEEETEELDEEIAE